MLKIGGEFSFEYGLSKKKSLLNSAVYSSGRQALYDIIDFLIKEKNIKSILCPDYICESVVNTIRLFNLKLNFFKVGFDFMPKFSEREIRNNDAIIIVNYFGLMDLGPIIMDIKSINNYIYTVEDNVQAFWEMLNDQFSDFSFTSLRKTFPVHEGGILKSCFDIPKKVLKENQFSRFKWVGSLIKSLSLKDVNIPDFEYLELFEKGEELLDNTKGIEGVSSFFKKYSENIDVDGIKKIRKENSSYLVKLLEDSEIQLAMPVKSEKVPLFLPIFIKNRNLIRTKLFKSNIFLPVHWPGTMSEISKNELSLVIDHRYKIKDMKYQFEKLIEAIG